MKKLNYREEEASQYNLTEKESIILSAFVGELYAEENFSDVSPQDLQKITGISQRSYKGVLGSLTKKGVLYIEDKKELGTDMDIVYLSNTDLHPDWYQARNPKKAVATKLSSLLTKAVIGKFADVIKKSEETALASHLGLAQVVGKAYEVFNAEGPKGLKLHTKTREDFCSRMSEVYGEPWSKSKNGRYTKAYSYLEQGVSAEDFIGFINEEHGSEVEPDRTFSTGYPAYAKWVLDTAESGGGEGEGEESAPPVKAKVVFSLTAKSDEDSGTENGIERGVSVRVLTDGSIETTSGEEETLKALSLMRKALQSAEAKAKFKANSEVTVSTQTELEDTKVSGKK